MPIDINDALARALDIAICGRAGVPIGTFSPSDFCRDIADRAILALSGAVSLVEKAELERLQSLRAAPVETLSEMAQALTQSLKEAIRSIPQSMLDSADDAEAWDAATAQLLVSCTRLGLCVIPTERYYQLCGALPAESPDSAFRRGAAKMLDLLDAEAPLPPYAPPEA